VCDIARGEEKGGLAKSTRSRGKSAEDRSKERSEDTGLSRGSCHELDRVCSVVVAVAVGGKKKDNQ